MQMQDKVISSVAAHEMDTSGYQASDLEDIEVYWEALDLNTDTDSRPGIDTPFWTLIFTDFEIIPMIQNPIDKEDDKEDSLLLTPYQSLKDQLSLLCCWGVVLLEREEEMFLTIFRELCLYD